MDFSHKVRIRTVQRTATDDLAELYPHSCMLYRLPPLHDITIQTFEDLAVERLKVLRILEQAATKHRTTSDEYRDAVLDELNAQKLKSYVRLIQHAGCAPSAVRRDDDLDARQRDYVAHFILRFAYAKSEELRRWFVKHELDLFRLKFAGLGGDDVAAFVRVHRLDYTPLDAADIEAVKDGLYESTGGYNLVLERMDFYRVPFAEVLDLVQRRRCYLRAGWAYVSTKEFISVMAGRQERCIHDGLLSTLRMLPAVESDERLFQLIRELHSSYTGKDFTVGSADRVPIECLDQLARKSFPLCMRTAHEHLRQRHHHKYGGRMQYSLFLKGIGVTLEDCLLFFQQEFTKIMDYDKFSKEYAYNIRHNYGKEGSMINYNPYSCMKIITTGVGPGDSHGCPFRSLDAPALRARLTECGLGANHVQEVGALAAKGQPQLACGRYFEVTLEAKLPEGVTHPNGYFERSQAVMAERTGTARKTAAGGAAEDVVLPLRKQPAKRAPDEFDAGYDEELWNAVDKVQSQADQTEQLELMDRDDDEYDLSTFTGEEF